MAFAQRLSELLKKGNMTAYRLSKTLGVHQTTVKNWLEGNSTPRTEYIEKIAEHFGVSIDYLMGNSDASHSDVIAKRGTSIVDETNEGDGAITYQIKQLNALINYDPVKTWNFLSVLCRNERIERDLTERYVAQTSNIPLQEYLRFEVTGTALQPEYVIYVLEALGLNPTQVFNFFKGYMAATIKNNNDREKFLSEQEIERETLLNKVMLQISQLSPEVLEKVLDEFLAKRPNCIDHDFENKMEKAIMELRTNKNRPQNEPGADG